MSVSPLEPNTCVSWMFCWPTVVKAMDGPEGPYGPSPCAICIHVPPVHGLVGHMTDSHVSGTVTAC
jgi:hypothetical protein